MTENTLLSIQAGQAITVGNANAEDPMQKPWTSAIFKQPLSGTVFISVDGLPGDEHVYEGHGGLDKAVFIHSAQHYSFWEQELQLSPMPFGGMGENFTVDGMLEIDVCLGDIYRAGEVLLQVTQPRPPCWKLSRRFGVLKLSTLIEQTGRTGFYFRVLEEGKCQAGDSIVLEERLAPNWNVARVYHIYQDITAYPEEAKFLAEFPLLAVQMRNDLHSFIEKGSTQGKVERLIGPNQ